MPKTLLYSLLAACVLSSHFIEGATRTVNSTSNDPTVKGTLAYWLLNAKDGDKIDCNSIAGQTINLTTSLPAITQSYTINGAGITIDGASSYQAFQVASGNVIINNVTVKNAISKGGDGGDGMAGGGGAVGGGGALYIHGGTTVTLTASSLLENIAQGGGGGSANFNGHSGGGGGGGFGGGNGGNALTSVTTGGGGGGHSNGGDGGTDGSIDGSNGVYFGGGGGGAGINFMASGGKGGSANTFVGGAQSDGNGGGGAGDSQNGNDATGSGGSGMPGNGGDGIGADLLFGGGGGGGASSDTGFVASGAGAGGGGGGTMNLGGAGGILGGGGGGIGGEGGFGSGGGGGIAGGTGGGGFGAGGGNGGSDSGAVAAGGGGSGLGGAIFIQSGASLTIVDAAQISGNLAIAGVGGTSNTTNSGYVAAGDGAALGYDIFMREQGSITFDLSNTLTIATPIEGDQTNGPNTTGGLQKIGNGTLKLNGANTYSGLTTVDGGTLNLNGSVIGSVIVGAEGTFSGNATVSGNLTNSGVLSPGNSIGTMNTTNLILTPSSLLEMEVASDGTNDLIAATETAQIDGTLEVIQMPGCFQTVQSYTIITAGGGRSGIFSRVESNVPSLLEVIYEPTAVVVKALPINALMLDSNAAAAAFCYLGSGITTGSDVETVNAALLTLDAEGINDSFNRMQPSQFSGLAWSQIENALLVRSGYSQHLEEVNLTSCCCKGLHVWGEAIGAWQKQNSYGQQFGFTDWTGGATVGLDAVCCNQFRLGIAGSYTYSHLNWSRSAGRANTNSYYGGLYSNWSNGRNYVNASLLGAYSRYHTNRHLHFATIDRHAKSSNSSWETLAGLEAGINFGCVIPFVRADYVYLSRQHFVEKGAESLNLRVDRVRDQIVQSEVGVKWTGRYVCACAPGTIVPRIQLSYINDASISNRHLKASFVDSDCNFTVQGLNFWRNLEAVSLGLTYLNCNESIGVTVRYDGQFGSHYYNQAADIALEIKF